MGTDRDEVGSGKCPCGKGLITVEKCSPDHGWGGSSWIEGHLSCAQCSQKYQIIEDSHLPRLVLKSDVAARKAGEKKWGDALRAVQSSTDFTAVESLIDERLRAEPSKAAQHRLLLHHRMVVMPIARYRREGFRLDIHRVPNALKMLQIERPGLLAAIAALDDVSAAIPKIPSVKPGIAGMQV